VAIVPEDFQGFSHGLHPNLSGIIKVTVSLNSFPSCAINVGFVVTPSTNPISLNFLVASILTVSTNILNTPPSC
jgi:hypothetical protein